MGEQKIVLIDPGHGFNAKTKLFQRPLMLLEKGKTSIASSSLEEDDRDFLPNYYREDNMTLLIAMETIKALSDLGYKTYSTRADKYDCTHHLSETLETSTSWKRSNWKSWQWIKEAGLVYKPDAFVSIHTNAAKGSGVSCFYEREYLGRPFAENIAKFVAEAMGSHIRRLDIHRYMILRDMAKGNACLVECGFHDNPKELALLLDPKIRQKIGEGIAKGIDKTLKKV